MACLKVLVFVSVFVLNVNAMTFQEKYQIWSQDLKPGFIIEQSVVDGRRCYCKVPQPTTTTPPNTTTTTTPTTTSTTTTTPTTTSTTTTTPTTTSTTPPTTSTTTTSSTTTTTTPTTTSTTTTTTPTTTTTTTTPTTTSTTTTTTPTTTTTTTPTTTTTSTSTTPTTSSTSTSTTPTTTTTSTTSTSTTPTTTSTSTSTTPTTTTTSTTSTPTTTTASPSTTTTRTTTTTKATVNCGSSCNVDLHVNTANFPYGSSTYTWKSPNYPSNYPDGCVCTLNVYLEAMGIVNVDFASGSTIYGINNCAFDKLTLSGDLDQTGTYCDTQLPTVNAFMANLRGTTVKFKAIFVSDGGDGNTIAKGFQMNLSIDLWMWGRKLNDSEGLKSQMRY